MMKIISHRGLWHSADEKNSSFAFSRSFSLGFGTETDVRDYMGELVISHDIPRGGEMLLQDFLALASTFNNKTPLTLALNIKADGLAQKLSEITSKFPELNIFVFDMSVPDTRAYFANKVPVFSRMSEFEQNPLWIDFSVGIWLDAFETEWYGLDSVIQLLSHEKKVCLVSPELLGRQHMPLWERMVELKDHPNFMICTDLPMQAKDFFKVKN